MYTKPLQYFYKDLKNVPTAELLCLPGFSEYNCNYLPCCKLINIRLTLSLVVGGRDQQLFLLIF